MRQSRALISEALSNLKNNMERTGDPLGLKNTYWTDWAEGLNLPKEGSIILFTSRMYQMMPYIMQTTDLISTFKPFLVMKGLSKVIQIGNRLAGEKIIRLKARGAKEIKEKGAKSLKGIVAALKASGVHPAYLYEAEPYSGVLLYDLGLIENIGCYIKKVYELLKNHGVEKVIATDPHTVYMLKVVYPKYIEGYDIEVKHYLEILAENRDSLKKACDFIPREQFVIHDSCIMTRDLGIVERTREVSSSLGIALLEPENAKLNTVCCGGPIEYAFADMSEKISTIRIKELYGVTKNIVVNCPICLINFSKYEKQLGLKVLDMGELLFEALKNQLESIR